MAALVGNPAAEGRVLHDGVRVPHDPDRVVVIGPGASTRGSELECAALALARALPAGPAAVNLCEDRRNFLVGFLALLIRGQTCLLPPSRMPVVVADVLDEHPGSYRLDDALVETAWGRASADRGPVIEIPPDRVVMIGYTSGSTGRPTANPKTWRSLLASSRLNTGALLETLADRGVKTAPYLLATVPSQHMYGMETSVLLPLLSRIGIHRAHPLYPADIAAALADLPGPRVLVTTPVHLRALLQSSVELPAVEVIVSATAPLPAALAEEAEDRLNATVLEFFGSTETCVIATRRTARESAWRTYPGIELRPQAGVTEVRAAWMSAPNIVLQDTLEISADGTFQVVGRHSDMVEVAGKRASLADLTRRLLSVPGVTDAVVFQPAREASGPVRRLAALVVASGQTEASILSGLAPLVDRVFLPRPLVLVERLPRNEVGKLPREQLTAALEKR